jgi:transcriptional regulator with XRE-family HTH domain
MTLRAVRLALHMSQDEFAKALRRAGAAAGEHNEANKRLVQRWESGTTQTPRGTYARALLAVTGMPVAALGFTSPMDRVAEDGRGGHDMDAGGDGIMSAQTTAALAMTVENYTGIWLSRYEFYSSSRENTYTGAHYVVLLQQGNRLTGTSMPGTASSPDSRMTMDLTVDRNIVTGTWVEQTASDGYYRGGRYHGAIQMLVEPTGRRMSGKWLGFGKNMDINSGPWELTFQSGKTDKATLEEYAGPPAE